MLCPRCGQENLPALSHCNSCGVGLDFLIGPASSTTGETATSGSFVGRQREMAALGEALGDTLSGRGRLVLLVGEPGIGKTRTAQEMTAQAAQLGAQVLWGWCYEQSGAPPYWPWVQPLRSYLQQHEAEQLRAEMGPGAASIAEIVPDLRDRLPDLAPPPSLDPEQARFRLFESITTFLKNAARVRPLVLVLDDLHWADQPSLLLLQFLARQLGDSRLLVVGCYRDVELSRQHLLSETLAQLAREPVFHRVPLRSLSREDTRSFVEAMVGARPSEGLVEAVYVHTEGNPFFMAEVVRFLREQGKLTGEAPEFGQDIGIPDGVREVIGQRLNCLSEQCYRTLSTASIIGREFELKLLSKLNDGVSEEQLLASMEEALEAHLIEEVPRSAEAYQFSHALVQETLASELLAARRARLHARIGETLEEQYGPDASEHAAALAYHFAEAGPVLGTQKLAQYSLVAGERALAVYAHEEALVLFQRALEAKQGQPTDVETADLLFGLARSQLATVRSNDLGEVVATLRRAFDYYIETEDVARAVAVAEFPIQGGSINLGRADIASRALALVTPGSHQAGRLLFTYGFFLYQERGDYEGSREALGEALSIARREGDRALELRTLVGLGHVEAYHLHFQESLQYDLEAIELARQVDDPFQETHAQIEVASVLEHLGDLEGARRHATTLLAEAEHLGNRMRLSQALRCNMAIALLEGNWPDARALNQRGLGLAPGDHSLLGYRAIMEYTLGDFEQGAAHLERLLEVLRLAPPSLINAYAYTSMVISVVAQIAGMDVHQEVAQEAAQVALSAPGVTPVSASMARAGLALLAARRGDIAGAREQYVALESRRGTMLGGTFESAISADRLLGILAHTMGNLELAMAHFEDALTFCRQAGYRPELAWTCYDCAEALLQRNSTGDRARARLLLDEALSITGELGMLPLRERVLQLLEDVESGSEAVPAYPDGLSRREVEVLRLIALGKSNPEIAQELIISPNTVAHHVTNILNKTSSANRTEAATYAAQHGLI